MDYTTNDIDKILEFKTWSDRRKIDELLRMDCEMYTNLGIDSTKKEKSEVTKNSRRIYKAIKTIDQRMGQTFLLAMDPAS
jgi:hypothetical protein